MTELVAAVAVGGTTFLLTGGLARLAPRWGLVDAPAEGKTHTRAIPTLGGLPIVLVFFTALWAAQGVGWGELTRAQLIGLTVGTLLVTGLGVWDDLVGVSAWGKLGVQALAGLIVYAYGFQVTQLTNPWDQALTLGPLGMVVTVVWLVVVTNAVNVIDGVDGLAAGVVAIAAFTLFGISLRFEETVLVVPSLLLAVTAAGFLPLNWPPARVFLGDTGSLSLGFLIGALSLLENRKGTVAVTLLLPIVLLGIPLLDAAMAVVRRVRAGQHPFRRDTRHLHHRLLELGLTPRQIVTLIYGLSLYLAVTAYLLSVLPKQHVLLVIVILGLGVALGIKTLQYIERGRARGGPRHDGP